MKVYSHISFCDGLQYVSILIESIFVYKKAKKIVVFYIYLNSQRCLNGVEVKIKKEEEETKKILIHKHPE